MSYSSSVTGRDGFPQLLRAEWTKLRSLRSTWVCVVLTIGLTVLMAVLAASGNKTSANEFGPQRVFAVQFVHQPMAGDGTIVAHLDEQEDTGPDAKAGLLITGPITEPQGKRGATPDAGYAAIMVTPGHGVEWQGDFTSGKNGSTGAAPRWLKLTRDGTTVTGYESPDGAAWTQVGTIDLPSLPDTAEVGMFVTSPPTDVKSIRRSPGSTESGPDYTLSTAAFDSVSVTTSGGEPLTGSWQGQDTSGPQRELPHDLVAGSFAQDGDRFTLTGAGDLGVVRPGAFADDDPVRDWLNGVIIGFIAIAVMGALFITTEYRRGIIRTTFTATPRRGSVLAAKSVVVGAVALVTGVVAATIAVLLARPIARDNGFAPPAYPLFSLSDAGVLRAVVGTGLVLALLAMLALALGALLRHSAATLTIAIAMVVLPFIVGPFLTLGGEAWLRRVTPGAGLAIQQTRERFDDAIGPWPGLAVLCGWVAVVLALAFIQLRRRDA